MNSSTKDFEENTNIIDYNFPWNIRPIHRNSSDSTSDSIDSSGLDCLDVVDSFDSSGLEWLDLVDSFDSSGLEWL